MIRRHLHAILPLLVLVALSGCNREPETYTVTAQAFSRPLQVTIQQAEQPRAKAAAKSAIEDLQFIAEVSHPWKPGPLGRTNQLFSFEAEFSANPSILPMIRRAAMLSAQTEGYYAPALGKLQQLWGFHSEYPEVAPPEQGEIDTILGSSPQMDDIKINGIRMRSTNADLRIDFGAFALGYALDTARERLREQGIRNARIDNGTAVVVLGEDWGLKLPTQQQKTLPLHNGEAAVTLSTESHAFTNDNEYHSYLDPTTGYPSLGLHSVTVIHSSAASAAALAQALLAGGEGKLGAQLEVLSVNYALVITREGKEVITPALAMRLGNVRKQ